MTEPFIQWETLMLTSSWLLGAVAIYLAATVAGVVWFVGLGAWHLRKKRRQPESPPPPVVSRVFTADDLAEIVELEKALRVEWREELRP